jgi:preprotein translocase subunit YajC
VHFEALTLQPAGPKAGMGETTASTAAPSAPAGGQPQQPGGAWISFLPMLMIVPVFWLMSRKNKKEADARSKMKKGDQVVSTGGLVGELVEVDDRFAKVKIGPGLTAKMLVSALSPLDPTPAVADKKADTTSAKADKPAADAK